MNKPYLASRNHAILSSCDAGAGSGGGRGVKAGAAGVDVDVAAHFVHPEGFVQQPYVTRAAIEMVANTANEVCKRFFIRIGNGSMENASSMYNADANVTSPFWTRHVWDVNVASFGQPNIHKLKKRVTLLHR
jgi:hypothetical protein